MGKGYLEPKKQRKMREKLRPLGARHLEEALSLEMYLENAGTFVASRV